MVSLLLILFFVSQAPLQSATLTAAGARCSQTPGMVFVEGVCVSAADNMIVDGLTPTTPRPAVIPERKKKAPRVNLMCSPKLQIGAFHPVSVTAYVRIMDPNEKFWCPEVQWTINGEFAGEHTGDCKPYETIVAEEGEPETWSENPKRFGFYSGIYVITVKLSKAGRLIAQESCTVQVK